MSWSKSIFVTVVLTGICFLWNTYSQTKVDFQAATSDWLSFYHHLPRITISYQLQPNESTLCLGFKCNVIFVAYSELGDYQYRATIRDTWGSSHVMKQTASCVVFPLGTGNDSKLQNTIVEESQTFGDILQGTFVDSYENLTYKGLLMLQWASRLEHPPGGVLKVDSDIFVNVLHLQTHLKQRRWQTNLIACNMYWRSKVLRPSGWCGKWCIQENDYRFTYYPPYCLGSFYYISGDLVPHLYRLSQQVPLWWVSDVYLTGHLPLKLGHIRRVVMADHMEKNTTRLFTKLTSDPKSVLFGYIQSKEDIKRAWKILQKQEQDTI